MNLILTRAESTGDSTFGRLYINGQFFCYTLEDMDRKLESGGAKIYGKTAIPRGEYEVVIDYSQRFKQEMPRLLDVPQFEGIRIHPGNTHEDTHGCILVGTTRTGTKLLNSRVAYQGLMNRLDSAYSKGEPINITVT